MNIKLLKFIVIFMGVVIFFGIITLGFALYFKFKNLSNVNNTNSLIIKKPNQMKLLNYKILENKIFVSFESETLVLIKVFNIKTGKNLKEIEILK